MEAVRVPPCPLLPGSRACPARWPALPGPPRRAPPVLPLPCPGGLPGPDSAPTQHPGTAGGASPEGRAPGLGPAAPGRRGRKNGPQWVPASYSTFRSGAERAGAGGASATDPGAEAPRVSLVPSAEGVRKRQKEPGKTAKEIPHTDLRAGRQGEYFIRPKYLLKRSLSWTNEYP